MADSANIGANFSDYKGDANLGGAGLGVFDIDTKPLQQLAQYTFFYKKNLWEQKQKETDAKVSELADLSKISLNDLRGKDKEQATKEFSDLLSYASEYARKDPKTAQEKIQNELDWQTKYGAFKNNYNSGKARATSYYAHLNTIKQDVTNAATQDEAIKQLNKTFDDTDISTPISAVPNFKIEKFDVPEPKPNFFQSEAILGNDNLHIEASIYNPKYNAPLADAAILGISKAYPQKGTKEYDALSQNEKDQAAIQGTIPSVGKGWVDAVEPLNSAIKKYVSTDGKFDAVSFENDNASNTTLMNAYNALKRYDAANRDKYNQALNGYFNDKGLSIPLPANVNPNDFKVGFVDFSKGVNANQLVQSGMYAKWTGDVFAKKVTHTGEANDLTKARLIQSGENARARMAQGGENYRKELELIGKGWIRDKKGKLQAPKTNSISSATNNGIVPYWQNYIAPQINPSDILKGADKGNSGFLGIGKTSDKDLPNDYTGDVPIGADKISGLSIAVLGEVTDEGKQKSVNSETEISVRLDKGNPIGLVIDGVFYDVNDINSKATRLNDKTVSNKQDTNIFDNTQGTPLTDAQKYLQSIK